MSEKANCEDCPPVGYQTDETRCAPCPRRAVESQVSDPFSVGLFGGLPKTGTCASEIYIAATIPQKNQNGLAISSLGLETKSSCELPMVTRRSRGGSPGIDKTGKLASSAAFSGMKARTYRLSLSDRLTPSLISFGLVCGITPSLTRKQSGQPIQVLALNMPVGGDAARVGRAYSCSSDGDA